MSSYKDRYLELLNFKNKTNNIKQSKEQRGGKLLGEGGFGCVISPPLRCKKTFKKTPYSIDKNYISKIVEYDKDDEEVWNEIYLGEKLLKMDITQKYFSPIINGCFLYKQYNGDLKYSKTRPYKLSSDTNNFNDTYSEDSGYNSSKSKKINKCNIYTDEKYLNLISKYAGINLEDVFDSENQNLTNYLINNYKNLIYHFCKGLQILKKNNILHCDIKTMNVMVNYNELRNKASMTYIDFGLSYVLGNNNKSTYEFFKFISHGTDLYRPLEILILDEYLDMSYHSKYEFSKKKVLNKVVDIFKHNRKFYINRLNFNRFGLTYSSDTIKNHYDNDELEYGNKKDIITVFKKIHELYENKNLLDEFIGKKDNIYKWDLFSLGIVLAEILYVLNIQDQLANDLISKMVHPFFWERWSIEECLEHPFFKQSDAKKLSVQVKKNTKKTKTKK
jgi:serine/threonine protein kinase